MTDFQAILIELRNYIVMNVPQFGKNGYVIDEGNDNAFKGLTDAIEEYFYIDFQDGSSQVDYDRSEEAYKTYLATANLKLVARTKKYTAASMGDVLFACVSNFADTCQVTANIENLTTDEAFIFSQETGEEIPKPLCLVLINFTLSTFVNKKKTCVELVCKKPSC